MRSSLHIKAIEFLLVAIVVVVTGRALQDLSPRLLAAQSNTWQYMAAFDELRNGSTRDAFFPNVAAAPIHGSFFWWAAKWNSGRSSWDEYPQLALAIASLRVVLLWLAARMLRMGRTWRMAVVGLSVGALLKNGPNCSEIFEVARTNAAVAFVATYRFSETLDRRWALVAGTFVGLTFATHLPTGVIAGLVLLFALAVTLASHRRWLPPGTAVLAVLAFAVVSFPMIVQAARFWGVPRSWEGDFRPWQAYLFRRPVDDFSLPLALLPVLAILLLRLIGRGEIRPVFWLASFGATLALSLPPAQALLTGLLNASTASHVLEIYPSTLIGLYALEALLRARPAPSWRPDPRAALTLGVALLCAYEYRCLKSYRYHRACSEAPGHGFAEPNEAIRRLVAGKVVLTDPWTAFVGRSARGLYSIAYAVNQATTIADSAERRTAVYSLFYDEFSITRLEKVRSLYPFDYILINHRLERGETDPARGRGKVISIERLRDKGWDIILDSRDFTILSNEAQTQL